MICKGTLAHCVGFLTSNNIQWLSLEGCTHAGCYAAVPTYGMANCVGCVGRWFSELRQTSFKRSPDREIQSSLITSVAAQLCTLLLRILILLSHSALPPSCKFKVKRTILTKRKHTTYTPTSNDGDPNMDGTTYNSNCNCFSKWSTGHCCWSGQK